MTNLIVAVVTAYTWTGDKTASGVWPVAGITVAAPRSVPFGTRVWIEGVGPRIVQDRMNRRFPDRWDVYCHGRKTAVEFGRKPLKIVIGKT